MQTLSQIKENNESIVVSTDISMPVNFRRRLFEMGLCTGTHVKIIKSSSLKKSLLIKFNCVTLSIQKKYADLIYVRP